MCQSTKRCRIRVRRLTRKRRSVAAATAAEVVGIEMAMKNLKLYLENRNIIQENEKLREKALLLHQENQALMIELQKKISNHLSRHEISC